jgi:hypothetical protein
MSPWKRVLVENPDLLAAHLLSLAEKEAGHELPATRERVDGLLPVLRKRLAARVA